MKKNQIRKIESFVNLVLFVSYDNGGKIEILTDLKTLLLLLDPAPQALLALQILLDYPDPFLHPPTKRDLDMYTVNSFTHDCKTVIFTSWMRSWRQMTSRRE